MEDNVFLDGKKYISARRASQISGYNSDYLGQLCRGNKLESKFLSRNWFVEENSLLEHIKSNGRKKNSPLLLEVEAKHKKKIFFSDNEKNTINIFQGKAINDFNLLKRIFNTKILVSSFIAIFISISISLVVFDLNNLFVKNTDSLVLKPIEEITANIKNSLPKESLAKYQDSDQPFLRVIGRIVQAGNNFKRKVAGWFKIGRKLSVDKKTKTSVIRKGSVIVPTPKSGEGEKVDLLRKHIEESFSDEVEIVENQSKTSGVIKPVFRKDTGEEYLYVMVPIK